MTRVRAPEVRHRLAPPRHSVHLPEQPPFARRLPRIRTLLELTKARLVTLVVATSGVGYVFAGGEVSVLLLWAMAGTALAAAGSMALTEWQEAHLDARMERTRRRPLPAGEMAPPVALAAGLGLAATGVATLATLVNVLTAALGLAVILLYTLVYTPLKTRTPLATLVRAICGGATVPLNHASWSAS